MPEPTTPPVNAIMACDLIVKGQDGQFRGHLFINANNYTGAHAEIWAWDKKTLIALANAILKRAENESDLVVLR
jgi:hypothetical protein